MNEEKFFRLQQGVKQNNEELVDFLNDLKSWKSMIKKKDDELTAQGSVDEAKQAAPVRNSGSKRKKSSKTSEKKNANKSATGGKSGQRISSYDYRAWDQFDVDKALNDVDKPATQADQTRGAAAASDASSDSSDSDDEHGREQRALDLKERANVQFKDGQLVNAIELYSQALQCAPSAATRALVLANRAMALLKQQKWAAAEQDCSAAIELDPDYCKSYMRRATARIRLSRPADARADLLRVLALEPTNGLAARELHRVDEALRAAAAAGVANAAADDADALGIVLPVDKAPDERSRRPLQRVLVQEVDSSQSAAPQPPLPVAQPAPPPPAASPSPTPPSAPKPVAAQPPPPSPTEVAEAARGCRSAYQFAAQCRSLAAEPAAFGHFLTNVDERLLGVLVGQTLDGDLLSAALRALAAVCAPVDAPLADAAASFLNALVRLQRFDFVAMFLTDSDKINLQTVLQSIAQHQPAKADAIKAAFDC